MSPGAGQHREETNSHPPARQSKIEPPIGGAEISQNYKKKSLKILALEDLGKTKSSCQVIAGSSKGTSFGAPNGTQQWHLKTQFVLNRRNTSSGFPAADSWQMTFRRSVRRRNWQGRGRSKMGEKEPREGGTSGQSVALWGSSPPQGSSRSLHLLVSV